MPTINQLAPATAAADSDELLVSQNLITRKVTRAQVLAGVQAQLNIPAGTILGRTAAEYRAPETIAIGSYLIWQRGLSLPWPHHIPWRCCQVASLRRLATLCLFARERNERRGQLRCIFPGSDGNRHRERFAIASDAHRQYPQPSTCRPRVIRGYEERCDFVGPADPGFRPNGVLQATTKQYVDVKVNRGGDTLTGPLQLAADPVAPLQAATKNYVDSSAGLLHLGFTLTGAIVLAGDPTVHFDPRHKTVHRYQIIQERRYHDGPLGLLAAPVSTSRVATEGYVDTQVATSLPIG